MTIIMKIIKAQKKDLDTIYSLVQTTINEIYPKYYPKEIVEFFSKHHSKINILNDIYSGFVYILFVAGKIVGTGTLIDNHITRLFVLPECQSNGYGKQIMQYIEMKIQRNYSTVYLDSSLPASVFYEKQGYKTISHEKCIFEKGAVLVYEIIQKQLHSTQTKINYDGRIFIVEANSENGELCRETIFKYHQNGNQFWAEYDGGSVIIGHILGIVSDTVNLKFYYHHINKQNDLRIGYCESTPIIDGAGKIKLYENWKWLNGDESKGTSVLIER